MSDRKMSEPRKNGLAMGRSYVDRIVQHYPGAIHKMREALKKKTLQDVSDSVLADTLKHLAGRGSLSEADLTEFTKSFLESACARVEELIAAAAREDN